MKELELIDINDNLIDTKDNYSIQELLTIEAIKNLDNPFKSLTTKDVASDLNVSMNKVHEIFKREDFPAIMLGKSWVVMQLAYLIWKFNRKD